MKCIETDCLWITLLDFYPAGFSRSFAQSLTLPLIRPMVWGMTGVLTPREKVAIIILLLIKLGKKLGLPLGEMDNQGNYIVSISKLTKIFYVSLYLIYIKSRHSL